MSFTTAQQRVLDFDGMELLVIAGAGSGKTHVVTELNANLIRRGVSPGNLQIFTFTRRAANEMRTRLVEKLGGGDDARRIVANATIGTFHSIAFKMLRAWGHKLGYDAQHLTVVPPKEADALMRQIAGELDLYSKKKWRKQLSWEKVRGWREAYYTGREVEAENETDEKWLKLLLVEYINRLRSAQALDFGLILKEVKRLFAEYPEVLHAYHRSVKHVTVDEVQDTDREQYNLHQFMLPAHGGSARVVLVGDRRQAIYGFRGADASLITTCYPDAEVIDLKECFRCGERIVEAANHLIAHNNDPLATPMVSATGSVGTVEAFAGDFRSIVRKIAELRDLFEDREIAVLARTHAILERTDFAMNEAGLPCQRVGQSKAVADSDEFAKLHAAMRLIHNRRDRLALDLVSRDLGIDAETRQRLVVAANYGTPIFDAYLQTCAPNELGNLIGCLSPNHDVGAVIEQLRDKVTGDAPELYAASAFWLRIADKSIAEALEWYSALDWDKGEDHEKSDKVTLITAHAAKGLEWPAVIVAGLNEGIFPSSKAIRANSIVEERNLAYVALTRAKTYVGAHYLIDPEEDRGPPSRFIEEAGIQLNITEDSSHVAHHD